MDDLNLVYESQGINNYVCLNVMDSLSRFQVKMLENNEIPGILSMHGTVLNGVCKLHYDITKMQRLSDVLKDGISGQEARRLLLNLLKALVNTEEYLLSMTRCVLHMDYIFVKEGSKVGMVYLPFEERTVISVDAVRVFFQNILAEYLTDDNDIYFLNLLKYVNKQDFSIAGLMEKLEEGAESKERQVHEGLNQKQIIKNEQESSISGNFPEAKKSEAKKPVFEFTLKKEKLEEKKIEKKQDKKAEVKLPWADGIGFKIPGMEAETAAEPKKEELKKPVKEAEKEKKAGLLGGLIGIGKKVVEPQFKAQEAADSKKIEPPKAFFGKQEISGNKFSVQSAGGEGGWKGTQMLETESTGTVVLGMQEMPQLIYAGNSVNVTHFPFHIGNGKVEVDFVIPKEVISKDHASIQCSQGRYYVKDENSLNHTYVNGKILPPYTEIELHSGDVIRLAYEEVTFRM